ncbi:hypothetical protein BASA81_008423 [Batrachochytrium salamandrivorans]|nr:hypothetical protein BASA81_008423 [Batrachochytrium salamandrivorans]
MKLVLLVLLVVVSVFAKVKDNLPPNSPLRIGVKFRPESCDKKSESGDSLSMHYTGTLVDGSKFDSSRDRNSPQVIKGWDQGLVNMCVGEKRVLTIPSDLGYGDQGSGQTIPPKATLIFEVELMGIDSKQEL